MNVSKEKEDESIKIGNALLITENKPPLADVEELAKELNFSKHENKVYQTFQEADRVT